VGGLVISALSSAEAVTIEALKVTIAAWSAVILVATLAPGTARRAAWAWKEVWRTPMAARVKGREAVKGPPLMKARESERPLLVASIAPWTAWS